MMLIFTVVIGGCIGFAIRYGVVAFALYLVMSYASYQVPFPLCFLLAIVAGILFAILRLIFEPTRVYSHRKAHTFNANR